MDEKPLTYTVKVYCSNCKREYEMALPFGAWWIDAYHYTPDFGKGAYYVHPDTHEDISVTCKFCGVPDLHVREQKVDSSDTSIAVTGSLKIERFLEIAKDIVLKAIDEANKRVF